MTRTKKIIAAAALAGALALGGCSTDATVASQNLSKAAEQFEVQRRIVFVNGITGGYLLTIEGRCSIVEDRKDGTAQVEVTCKESEDQFKKHYLGLSDNVTYVVEQMNPVDVSEYHYRVIYKPEVLLPEVTR